jgi:hypothetical protein
MLEAAPKSCIARRDPPNALAPQRTPTGIAKMIAMKAKLRQFSIVFMS